jgi:hypothetical protein
MRVIFKKDQAEIDVWDFAEAPPQNDIVCLHGVDYIVGKRKWYINVMPFTYNTKELICEIELL